MPGYTYKVEDKSFIANGNVLFNLDTLPKGFRIRKLDLFFDLSGTKGASDALDGDLFARIVNLVRLGNFVNVQGMDLHVLQRIVAGRILMDPTDVPGSGTTFTSQFHLEVPFRDPRQSGSDDGSLPTELVMGKSTEVQFAAGNVHGVGTLAYTAGTVRCQAELIHETNVPQLNRLFYIDPNSQTIQLDPGVYKEMFIHKATGAAISNTEISQLDMEMDGQPIANNILLEQLAQWYNSTGVVDAAADLGFTSLRFAPVIWQERGGKSHLTKQPAAEKKGRLQLSGSLTNPHVVIWKALLKDESAIGEAAVKMGLDVSKFSDYEPAVASKSPMAKKATMPAGAKPSRKVRLATSALAGKFRVGPVGRRG